MLVCTVDAGRFSYAFAAGFRLKHGAVYFRNFRDWLLAGAIYVPLAEFLVGANRVRRHHGKQRKCNWCRQSTATPPSLSLSALSRLAYQVAGICLGCTAAWAYGIPFAMARATLTVSRAVYDGTKAQLQQMWL